MNPSLHVMVILCAAALAGCRSAAPRPAPHRVEPWEPKPMEAASRIRPIEFHFEYTWSEGSLPPPYHYEYTITVSKTGDGAIVMNPDYPGRHAPDWKETFTLKPEEMDRVYRLFNDNGLFSRTWRTLESPPVGGSHQSLSVMFAGNAYLVQDYSAPEDKPHAEAIYAAVNALVPKPIWDRLTARREKYQNEHVPE